MTNLVVIGKQNIGRFEFTGIEGGFGADKRAVTVKDIAAIHGKEVKYINKQINSNRRRFINGVDLIDFKTSASNEPVLEQLFSKAEIGNANNLFILSERGYAKLLKILEDDTAWELYDQLVDSYFNMRERIKTSKPRKKAINTVFRQEMSIAKTLSETLNVNLGIACSVAIQRTEAKTGESLGEYTKLLPPAEHETGYLIPSQIGQKFNLSAVKVNQVLVDKGLQAKDGKKWRMTEAGKQYGEVIPFTASNGHTDYQLKWNERVLEVFGAKDNIVLSCRSGEGSLVP
ncbi:ORF6N domain-containing protein [Listeria booriae]|uniref:ORF6N domain-containing protein n=1 Tax=Listeria booriae TaxID=1552123 RepID=UPI0016270F99|nr:ORF6N domain-containing protein [Listeria booriae]MBC1286905.1 ORF6N domain-containing protein [Listeria booriae]